MKKIAFYKEEIENETKKKISDMLCEKLADYCLRELQKKTKRKGYQKGVNISELLKEIQKKVLNNKERNDTKLISFVQLGLLEILIGVKELDNGYLDYAHITPISIDWSYYGDYNNK